MKVRGIEHQQLFERPVKLSVKKSGRGDVLLKGIPDLVFISDKVRRLLEANDATGFELLPADAELFYSHPPDKGTFWQLIVTGWGGVASPESGVREVEVEAGRAREFTVPTRPDALIDRSQYDGSDFFRFWPYPTDIVVTRRIMSLFDREGIKHCDFYPLVDLGRVIRMSIVGETTQALPLALYYPPERAENLGAGLGIDWYDFRW
jgi:hypothetical protein